MTWNALVWGGRKWFFFDSETLFSRFWGILAPVRGKWVPNLTRSLQRRDSFKETQCSSGFGLLLLLLLILQHCNKRGQEVSMQGLDTFPRHVAGETEVLIF